MGIATPGDATTYDEDDMKSRPLDSSGPREGVGGFERPNR